MRRYGIKQPLTNIILTHIQKHWLKKAWEMYENQNTADLVVLNPSFSTRTIVKFKIQHIRKL